MNLIEKLDHLEKKAKEAADSDWESRHETFEFSDFCDALTEAWPKLRAVVIAARYIENEGGRIPTALKIALDALKEPTA